jgi:hypothetical protein
MRFTRRGEAEMQTQSAIDEFAGELLQSPEANYRSRDRVFAVPPEAASYWLDVGDDLGAELEDLGGGRARLVFPDDRAVDLLPARDDDDALLVQLPRDVDVDSLYRHEAVSAEEDDDEPEKKGSGLLKKVLIAGAVTLGVVGVGAGAAFAWSRYKARKKKGATS